MATVRHYINGSLIDEPRNWQAITISADWLGRKEDATLNIDELEFAGDVAVMIKDLAFSGLNGGTGIFEGVPYRIEIGDIGSPVYSFDGYLDLTTIRVVSCNIVAVSLRKLKGADWLEAVADGFSFRYLFDIGVIKSSDFVRVPYVINYIPDTMQLLFLSFSTYMMTKELIENIKAIAEQTEKIINASTPVTGVGVGAGAVAVTAWDIGDFIGAILGLVAQIIYTIAIVIAIIKLTEQIIEQLMPPKRFHLGMSIRKLFEKACDHLGLTLESSLLDNFKDWVLIPSKAHRGGEKPTGFVGNFTELGVPNASDNYDTFGQLIRTCLTWFNADYKTSGSKFQLERRDFWDNNSSYVVPSVFGDQEKFSNPFILNTDEFKANYNINYDYDTQDQNTLDNQEGRVFQVITEPVNVSNASLLNMKGLEEIRIPFTLGVRKNKLTIIEEILKGFAITVDFLTGQLGRASSFSGKINGRIGSLLLSNHLTSKPKLVVMQGSKLANNQRQIVGANVLWEQLHYINSFVEINGTHDQQYRYLGVRVPFCLEDFTKLIENNKATTENGENAEVETIEYNMESNTAVIDYRVNRKYTNNLALKILE